MTERTNVRKGVKILSTYILLVLKLSSKHTIYGETFAK